MFHYHKTYITPNIKILDIIEENRSFLLFLQHFNIDFSVNNKKVKEICKENNIDLWTFITIGNLYNGFYPQEDEVNKIENILTVLIFLKNSHVFYKKEKYPELKGYIKKLKKNYNSSDFILIENFFNDYFNEVLVHLNYEEETAFPYFYELISEKKQSYDEFTAQEYYRHHTDIETKLSDLKNLFLKHLKLKDELNTKRKFLITLFELEFDLNIHSVIEEKILVPLIEKIEKKNGKRQKKHSNN